MDSSPTDRRLDSERVGSGSDPGSGCPYTAYITVTDMRNSSSKDGPANAKHHGRTRGEEGGSERNRTWADFDERAEAGDCSTPVEWLGASCASCASCASYARSFLASIFQ